MLITCAEKLGMHGWKDVGRLRSLFWSFHLFQEGGEACDEANPLKNSVGEAGWRDLGFVEHVLCVGGTGPASEGGSRMLKACSLPSTNLVSCPGDTASWVQK